MALLDPVEAMMVKMLRKPMSLTKWLEKCVRAAVYSPNILACIGDRKRELDTAKKTPIDLLDKYRLVAENDFNGCG